MLAQFDLALETAPIEYKPITDFDVDPLDFGDKGRQRPVMLTFQAIVKTYAEAMQSSSDAEAASLGPENIRFLLLLGAMASHKA